VKATASYVLNRAAAQKAERRDAGSGTALLALVTKVGTAAYTIVSTRADLRHWSGLPGRFSLARLEAAPGARLEVPGHPEASLTLPPGKVLLVSLKVASENTPVTLRCVPLVP
jgi:hypothetical protein